MNLNMARAQPGRLGTGDSKGSPLSQSPTVCRAREMSPPTQSILSFFTSLLLLTLLQVYPLPPHTPLPTFPQPPIDTFLNPVPLLLPHARRTVGWKASSPHFSQSPASLWLSRDLLFLYRSTGSGKSLILSAQARGEVNTNTIGRKLAE